MYRDLINSKSHTEWEHLIYEWVHDEMDRKILSRCLLDGATIENVADVTFALCQTFTATTGEDVVVDCGQSKIR